jgi:DNA-binding IclR family transcriptional regulator
MENKVHKEQDPDSNAIPAGGNQSLARGLGILALLAQEEGELGIRDLGRRMGISSSIVHRLVRTLCEMGFVEQNVSTQRYRIGFKAFDVGNSYLRFHSLETIAARELSALANEHQLNAFLGIIQGNDVVYLMTMQSSSIITIRSAPGTRAPLHSTAIAKAILIDWPDDAILELLGREPLAAVTSHTKTKPMEILKDIHEARRRGYAVSDEEYVEGVLTIGAPIRDRSGLAIAAISGAVPRHLHKSSDTARIAKLVMLAAARISVGLGAPLQRPAAARSE